MSHVLDYSGSESLAGPSRAPLAELLLLAGPTIAQMASYTIMQFIDTLMLARIGVLQPTAAGNSGGFAFSVISFGVGTLFVVNTLVSQSYGQGNHRACGRYLWQGIWWSVIFSVLLLPSFPFIPRLFTRMGHEPHLVELETTYFRIVVAASLLKLAGTALGQFLLAIDRPRWVLVSAVCGVSVNAVAAWLMLFGPFGLPRLGIAGAAWAQNIGVSVELGVLIGLVMLTEVRRKFNVMDWKLRWAEMKTLIVIGVPSGVQVVTEVLAWVLFGAWVIGTFGTKAMAAQTFMMRYMFVAFMPCFGISTAVTALVGRYIGMGRTDIAERRAHLGFAVAGVYITACGLLFYFGRYWLIGRFTVDPEVLRLGATLMIFAAAYEIFDAMYIVYNGALRGAGDTLVPAIAIGGLCWLFVMGGGSLVARYRPQWGIAGPWLAATTYGIILGFFMLARFKLGGWKSIHLEEDGSGDRVPDAGQKRPAHAGLPTATETRSSTET